MLRSVGVLLSAVSLSLVSVAEASSAASGGSFSSDQKKEIESVVRDYLLRNPAILIEMSQALEKDQAKAREAAVSSVVDYLTSDPLTPAEGPEKAEHTLIEFFDYNCGYCKGARPMIDKLAVDYPVRVVHVEMPVLSPMSAKASAIGLALYSMDREQYFVYQSTLMSSKSRLESEDQIRAAVEVAGASYDKVLKVLERDSDRIRAQLEKNMELANSIGMQGVPLFILDGKVIRGAVRDYDFLVDVIEGRKEP